MTTIERIGSGDAAPFDTYCATYRAAMDDEWDRPYSARELRVELFDDNDYTRTVVLLARDGEGDPVGVGTVLLPLKDNLGLAYIDVHITPARRREGHGTAIVEAMADIGREHGRTTLWAEARWGAGDEGSGNTGFAEALGFRLDLVDAHRVLFLPASLPEAAVRGGYALRTWRGPCPPEWIDDYANLLSLITQEAPQGDLALENEFFDAARVRRDEDNLVRQDRVMQSTIALSPDGLVAGHTQLVFPAPDQPDVFQYDTLVLPGHRGHGLGMSLKVHTMNAAADLLEGRKVVHTYNAASNRPMIDVNEAMGFRHVSNLGEFVRDI